MSDIFSSALRTAKNEVKRSVNREVRSTISDATRRKRGARPQPVPRGRAAKDHSDADGDIPLTGKLMVEVIEAVDIPAADQSGTSDPYVTIKVGEDKRKTKTIKKTLNPKWNEKFSFQIKKMTEIRMGLFDYDRFSSDDEIATFSLPLEIFIPCHFTGQPIDDWYGFAPHGELNLRISFKSSIPIEKPDNYDELVQATNPMNMGGVQPGMMQPGMQPGMMQPGMQPGMMQPGMMQPGMQPGMMQPGMQPGMMQPGMQPGMMQPGMMQPGMQGYPQQGYGYGK